MSRTVRRLLSFAAAVVMGVGLGVTPAAAAGAQIVGSLDSVAIAPDGSIRVTGWAAVRGGGAAMVHVYDTGPARTVGTDLGHVGAARPDVLAALRASIVGLSNWTGFDGTIAPAESGEHRICAYGVAGTAVALLGCRNLTTGLAPVGVVDFVPGLIQQGQQLRVRGWAYDPDRPVKSIQIHAYVMSDGGLRTSMGLSAASDRPDIAAAIPGAGAAHGFDQDVYLDNWGADLYRPDLIWPTGRHSVCLFAIGIGDGGNTLLGCRDVEIQPSVLANLDDVSASAAGEVTVRGWSFLTQRPAATALNSLVLTSLDDPDAARPEVVTFPADQVRLDVDTVFAGVGVRHGFTGVTTAVPPGRYVACLWTGSAPNPFSANDTQPARTCREVSVPNLIGVIDSVSVDGGPGAWTVTVRGWAIDPVHPGGATDVRVMVGEDWPRGTAPRAVTTTSIDRPDVNAVFGVTGRHGFETVLTAAELFDAAPVCAQAATYPSGGCPTPFATSQARTG